MSPSPSRGFTLAQWTFTFVPFSVFLAAALLVPEVMTPGGTPNLHELDHAVGLDNPAGRPVPPGTPLLALLRAIFCIWLSTALLIPGVCLYILRGKSDARRRYALLFWTFSYLAYLVHFYYTAFVIFGGVAGTFAHMRWWVAGTNFVLTGWWTLDVLIAWAADPSQKWVRRERSLALLFIVLVYVVTDLFLRPTIVRYLGAALAASVILSLLVRHSRGGLSESRIVKDGVMNASARLRTPQFLFVLLLFAAFMSVAHLAAEWRGAKDMELATALRAHSPEVWKGEQGEFPVPHSTLYYRIVFSIWVSTLLLTVALCFYALRRAGVPSNYWVVFWTFSYLAYLVHFYWAVGILFGWDFHAILNSSIGVDPNPEKVVCNPIPDLVLTVWWGLDVLLAWAVWQGTPRWLRIERGALSLFALVAFFGATVLAAKAGPAVRVLGVLMAGSVLSCYGLRIVLRPLEPSSLSAFLFVGSFRLLNLFRPWYRLPTLLGVMNLAALREVLRARNLHSTSRHPDGREVIPVTNPAGYSPPPAFDASLLTARQVDGYFNDLHDPEMGGASELDSAEPLRNVVRSNPGARFGRNVPLKEAYPESEARLLQPNPREISERLLKRDKFKRAEILNYLAAAWIQFETHDWFFHGNPVKGNEFKIQLQPGDSWRQDPMLIRRTPPDPTRIPNDGKGPPTYVNAESHWWDGSQVYGDDPATADSLRRDQDTHQLIPGGKLAVKDGLLPIDPATRTDMSGFTGNWWIGLTLLHTLFTLEHNALCDYLKGEYPAWSDDRIYNTARLVNAALMAKIHTVEWTPAILPNPVLRIGMNANWWGMLSANIRKAFGRVSDNEGFSGIPGSETAHYAAPFSLTEEFVAVYRMHPLMRDDIELHRIGDGGLVGTVPLPDLLGAGAREHIHPVPPGPAKTSSASFVGSMGDWFYSFGICNPGALVLRNYPNYLRDFERPDGERVDLASVDVMRDRERGVPRYNRFRELLHLPPVDSFKQMCDDPDLAKLLEDVYRDPNRVDLMVGAYAETLPPKFGFSDTAFRIFILMASRRLKSDRFFTTDFTPEVYSPAGMDWITNNGMTSILLRHYPELAPALRGVANPFAPWKKINESRGYQPYEDRAGASGGPA